MTSPSQSVVRPPIVAVLGHVDHGKSTLLDFIRKSNTVAKEAGGITQHVAAYEAEHKGKRITFIDTPGHAAFAAIRARGATVADIAILVVAADDGVKAQTLEALDQIRSAGTPFVVAINKIDKPNADIARTQGSLLEQGVYLETLGGDVPWTAISAKTGRGVEELLDLILLVAEMEEFAGDRAKPAEGYVIEAHRDPRRGIAATLIITDGTVRAGMAVRAGRSVAPVRLMENDAGKAIREASFSSPVNLIGFDELPAVGERFLSYPTRREAEAARPEAARPAAIAEESGDSFILPVIIRADTTGSLEAIAHETVGIGNERARLSIVQSGIGIVTEGDVKAALAGSVAACVIGFNVGVDPVAEALARERGVRIETFSIIYKLTEKLQETLEGATPKRLVEETVGRARIAKVFSSRKTEHTIGGKVLEGAIARKARLRLVRRDAPLGEGAVLTIQANKQNVERVETDREFGAQIECGAEPVPGDVIECFVTVSK